MLGTTHLPEMLFGNNFLELAHLATGIKIKFNALEALHDWKQENLPPVEVSAAAKWRFCSKPSQQVILDYDYTFTTPYSGSETIETEEELSSHGRSFMTTDHATSSPIQWVDCDDKIDLVALRAKDPILFYDEVVLYEDELADNGVSLLSVKVRVMPSCWFLLLRFWLRVDGVLMRLRDTRMHCSFQNDSNKAPVVIRERCHKEDTFSALALNGFPVDSSLYFDSAVASDRLTVRKQHCEKLTLKETNPKRVS
ncbi:hypothetical protein O6H91_03G073800 [Diphasiastrum complanatum]|nr:hypothetical protein O6H91_03G073800 [Diphasiastrum complanatum]